MDRPRKILTLCLITDGDRVLLGMKKRGFGAGWWNGFGGKLQESESLEDAAKREVLEEVGLVVGSMEKVGEIEFEFVEKEEILQVHIFNVHSFTGEPRESEEMRPQWFAFDSIPYPEMWPSDREWIPFFLAGKKFRGSVLFDENKKPLKNEIVEAHGF
jgi:8-oxo-dGTP diphosphatase / 2-hydroxy-dATP diphosphatase